MATPLMESQISTQGAIDMPIEFCSSDIENEPSAVTDCPAYAWDESDQDAIYDLRQQFGDAPVHLHYDALAKAAHWLIEPHLTFEWAQRGLNAVFIHSKSAFEDGATPGPDSTPYATPSDETYQQVWQVAANRITAADLVGEAELSDVFPLKTDLQRHRDALLARIERRRKELHARLDDWASDDMCSRAEQQMDGLRAAVDQAVTRAQLIAISESFA
jgi:hypothetical protein